MKRVLIFGITIALVLNGPAIMAAKKKQKQPAPVQWLTSLDAALQEAQRQSKPVFVDFFNPQ